MNAYNSPDEEDIDWSGQDAAVAAGAPKSKLQDAIASVAVQPDEDRGAALDSLASEGDAQSNPIDWQAPQGLSGAVAVKDSAPPMVDAAAPQKAAPDHMADRLAALSALGDGEETGLRDASKRDRERADQRQMSEFLANSLTGKQSRILDAGPSDLDTERLIQGSRDKRAALAEKAAGNPALDQSLIDQRRGTIERDKAISENQRDDLKRKNAKDVADVADKEAKRSESAARLTEERAEVAALVRALPATELGKHYKLKPEDLAGVTTRAGFDKYLDELKGGWSPAKAVAKGGGTGKSALVVNEGELAKIPAGQRNTVATIIRGDADLPTRSDPASRQIRDWVMQVDPNYSKPKAQAYGALYKGLTSGNESKQVNAVNVAIGHLANIEDVFPPNTDSQAWNKIKNGGLNALGSAATARFDVLAQSLAGELTGAYGVMSEHEVESYKQQLANSKSPEQLKAITSQFRHNLRAKLSAMEQQWTNLAPKGSKFQFLTPEAQAAMDRDAAEHSKPATAPTAPRPMAPGSIRIKRNGKPGTIPEAEFDPATDVRL